MQTLFKHKTLMMFDQTMSNSWEEEDHSNVCWNSVMLMTFCCVGGWVLKTWFSVLKALENQSVFLWQSDGLFEEQEAKGNEAQLCEIKEIKALWKRLCARMSWCTDTNPNTNPNDGEITPDSCDCAMTISMEEHPSVSVLAGQPSSIPEQTKCIVLSPQRLKHTMFIFSAPAMHCMLMCHAEISGVLRQPISQKLTEIFRVWVKCCPVQWLDAQAPTWWGLSRPSITLLCIGSQWLSGVLEWRECTCLAEHSLTLPCLSH